MIAQVAQVGQSILAEYAKIPIAFEVREVLAVVREPSPGSPIHLEPRAIAMPWVKDYDAIDGGPLSWPTRFDLTHWTFFVARVQERLVGAAAVVYPARDASMLTGRADVVPIWDLRVAPDARRHGVGRALMDTIEAWARAHEASWLEVETQDINAPACRFYAACGFELRAATRDAYPELPNETQLLWYKRLRG